MGRGRFSKVVSVLVTGIIALSGLPCKVLADVINAPTYYSVQSGLEYEITTNVTSSWINHTSVDFVVSNTGDEIIHNWYITFNTPYTIDNIWNGALYETDGNGTYTITSNGWNQDIHPGETVTVGATFSSVEDEALTIAPEWYLLNTEATIVDSSLYTLDYIEYSSWETGFTGQLTLQPQVDCQHWSLRFNSNRDITAVSSAVFNTEDDGSYEITHDENNMRLFADTAYNIGIQGVNSENSLEFANVELTVVDIAYHLTDDFDSNGTPDYLDFIVGGSIVGPTLTPTDVPTVSPTEEPTTAPSDTPSGTPTTEPFITEEPTETPTDEPTPTPDIDYELDRDLDGLPDYIENIIGTDSLKADSDDDNLSDYVEYYIGYDPTNPDSNGNGIADENEDYDNDGITNIQEITSSTNLEIADSDGDGIIDGEELYVYETDPLLSDSDSDGIRDGDEVAIGKNPADATDGTTRVSQTFTRSINNLDDPAITSVTVSVSVAGRIDRVLDVNDYFNVDVYSTDVYGRIGSPINFECEESFDEATVVITYDDSNLGNSMEENLGVLWFDESTGFYIIQEQAAVDTTNNTVTLNLNHFSTYILVDKEMWNNPVLPDYGFDLHYIIHSFKPVNGDASSISEEAEWLNCQEAYHNPNLIRLGGPYVEGRLIYGGFGWLGEYRFDWLIMNGTDEDTDCIPDFMESQGVLGTNHHIYYSDPTTEHSDDDGITDVNELGEMIIIVNTLYDGVKLYTKNNSGEISEYIGDYNLDDYIGMVDNNHSIVLSVLKSNPQKSDSDEDKLIDDVDTLPLYSDYSSVNLGGGSFDPFTFDSGYVHIVDYLYYFNYGYDSYYGGYQGWFGNYATDDVGCYTGIRINFQKNGCGIIAVNDVLLYLQQGPHNYQYNEYYNSVMLTADLFVNLVYVSYEEVIVNHNGAYLFAYAQGSNSIINAFENAGYSSERVDLNANNSMSILNRIEDSLNADLPVILFESDRLGGDGPLMYLADYRESTNPSSLNSFIVHENSVDHEKHCHYHYVTITGIVRDNVEDDVWLRVQSWGRTYYINFEDFVEYNNASIFNSADVFFVNL